MKLLVLLLAGSLQAATIHVPADQPTIQASITIATTGDTVLIADGIYTGEGNYNIDLLGKAITVRSANGAAACIIDLQEQPSRRAFQLTSGEDTTTVIEGFTIRNGRHGFGAGMYCLHSSVTVRTCQFERNSGTRGCGVWATGGVIRIVDCLFRRNFVLSVADCVGGGIYLDSSAALISSCRFDSNAVLANNRVAGGAIWIGQACTITIASSTFFNNLLGTYLSDPMQYGAAIACDANSTVTIIASQFLQNGINRNNGCALWANGSSVQLTDCHFLHNGQAQDFGLFGTYTIAGIAPPPDFLAVLPRYVHSGGAIYALMSSLEANRCIFADNRFGTEPGLRRGGAVVLDRSVGAFAGCTFADNEARDGHALLVSSSNMTMDSCIVAFNRTSFANDGYAVAADTFGTSTVGITCSDLFGNQQGDWVGVLDTLANQYNNFSLDPQFCRKSIANYQLQEDSPCRPAASPCGSLVGALPVEAGCNACCEGSTGNVNMAGIVDLADLSLLIAYLTVPAPDKPVLACVDEANVTAAGIIDLADLSLLVAYLTVPAPDKPTLPWCP